MSLKFLSFRAIEISRQNVLLAETDVFTAVVSCP